MMRWAFRQFAVAAAVMALVACSGSPASVLTGGCPVSSAAPERLGPGLGSGPVYLSGQTDWYAGGQAASLFVDPTYWGPLVVRGTPLAGNGSTITLADENLPPTAMAGLAEKEQRYGHQVVSATYGSGGELRLAPGVPSSSWREWVGRLSTSGPGCFVLQAQGDTFSEAITVSVGPGPAPPG